MAELPEATPPRDPVIILLVAKPICDLILAIITTLKAIIPAKARAAMELKCISLLAAPATLKKVTIGTYPSNLARPADENFLEFNLNNGLSPQYAYT